jgi:hypothetical protein
MIIRKKGQVIGWVSQGGCQNPACKRAIKAGRPFHAIPAGFATSLPDYHFETAKLARAALRAEALANPAKLKERERILKED